MKKIALTVTATLGLVSPAVAVPSNTSSTFPANGFMLQDYTYTNAATYGNMGVYSDSVAANANYNDCPIGYWCDASGQHACSDLDGGYDNAAAGATENTQCYRACTVDAANIAHAATVTGNDYYGTGTDTCSAAECENGYHTETFDLVTIIGDVGASDYGYICPNDYFQRNASTYGLTESGTFAVTYNDDRGTIKGHAQCSSQVETGSIPYAPDYTAPSTTYATLPDSTGKYCYCKVDSYTPVGGAEMSFSSRWVFYYGWGNATECSSYCGSDCAKLYDTRTGYLAWRAVVLGAVDTGAATCEANTISITWGGTSQNDIDANNAGTCTYGGEIRTPVAAAVIPGKTFVGWKFVKTPQEQGGE